MSTGTLTDTKRVVLYGRVSHLPDGRWAPKESRSVDDQLDSLRAWAQREGRTIVTTLRDDGVSASRYSKRVRAGWVEVMDHLSSGFVDELAVWEVSRSSRDRAVWAALIAACIENHVKLVVDGKVHDPADPEDGFMLDLGAALAVRESAMTSKRIRRATVSRAVHGAPHGRVPDGYRIEYDPTTGKPLRRTLDPERAPVIREIVHRLLRGDSAVQIAKDLNSRGITTSTGRAWNGANIIKRVQTPSIAGLRVHRGNVLEGVEAEWPPIVSVEEHRRLLSMLDDPRRKSNKEGNKVKYLGTGIFLCGICESPVRMISARRPDGTRRLRYVCGKSAHLQRALEPTDLKVEKTIVAFLSRPDILTELYALQDDADAERAAEEASELRSKLDNVRRGVEAGALSVEDLVYFRQQWEPKIREAEERARPKHLPTDIFTIAGPDALERWRTTPIVNRRAIVKALVNVTILPTKRGNQLTPFDADAIVVTRRGRQ